VPGEGHGRAAGGRRRRDDVLAVSRRVVLASLGLAALLVLLATSRPWVTLTLPGDLGVSRVAVPGAALAPLAVAAGVVALAGTLAALVSKAFGRRIVGTLVLLVSVAAVVQTVPVALAVDTRGRAWWAVEVGAAAGEASAVTAPAWPALTLAGLLACVASGLVVLVKAGGWRGLSSRYEAAPAITTDPWTALDRGEDPTAPPG
jgi:hypothetical protein